jgi:FKBP-type peptidyl-prolyl cis-trans isomerase
MVLIGLCSLILAGCSGRGEKQGRTKVTGMSELAELNRYLVMKDRERILNYIERKDLRMEETGSGLWYTIRSEGIGDRFIDNDRIAIEYECTLLDGTFCYSSSESGPKEIIIGKSRIESGLDQGLRMLRPGAEAVFIIPSFLAWGFPGDGNRIPSRAVVVYKISNARRL